MAVGQGFNKELVDIADIGDDTKRQQFLTCYAHKQSGSVYYYEDGNKAVRKYSCGQTKHCLWCRTKARKKLARQYYDLAIEAYNKYGMDKVWTIVFTLPQELEDKFEDKKQRQKITFKELTKLVKKAFGLKN